MMCDVFLNIRRKAIMVDESLDILFDAYSEGEEEEMSVDELLCKALDSVESCKERLDRIQNTE